MKASLREIIEGLESCNENTRVFYYPVANETLMVFSFDDEFSYELNE